VARLVVFDMDGVLVDAESSWVYVHRRFGVNNDHSLYAYLRGEIDDLEFIRRDIRLWMEKDPELTVSKIQEILAEVPLMPGARETIKAISDRGIKTAIVSAGIDLLADRVADELGVDVDMANGLITDNRGRLSGEGILRVKLMDKGDSVSEVATRLDIPKEQVVSVGNSQYDVTMFERSGMGIAFMPSDDHVRQSANAVVEEKDLRGILKYI